MADQKRISGSHVQPPPTRPQFTPKPRPPFLAAPKRPRRRSSYVLSSLIWAGIITLIITLAGVAVAVAGYVYIANQVPAPDNLWARSIAFKSTKIFDRNGQLLYEVIDPTGGKRTVVPLSDISQSLIWATIATEDATFYRNPGFNPFAIVRALYWDLTEGTIISGASGITQQLARQLYLNREQTFDRKLKEAILAAEITRRYSKDEILEIYLNGLYYGNLAYGPAAAAETYFDKDVGDLTVAQAALLAGLPQSTVLWDPYANPDAAKQRRAVVLDLMADNGYITRAVAEEGKQEPLNLRPQTIEIKAPHFVMYVRQLLEERYGTALLYRAGLQVYTTLDLSMQESAERIAEAQIASLKDAHATNASLVTINAHTGEILAMLGSVNFFDDAIAGQVNVTMQPRQPGSTIKPVLYAAAFEHGWNPATMIMDVRTEYPNGPNAPYVPVNYDGHYHGPVALRQALACSYNVPAVQTLSELGIPAMLEMAQRMGITTLNRSDYGLSLALGAGEVPLTEMVGAYAVLANGGVRVPLNPILRITDFEGNVLEEAEPAPQGKQVLDPRIAYLLTSILSDNEARAPAYGRQNLLVLSHPSAAKTGTTDDYRDAYVIGYTPDLVTGIWVGNSDNTQMNGLPGVRAAGPIWNNYMEEILKDQPAKAFEMPPGIVAVPVCPVSGMLPSEDCPPAHVDLFLEEAQPAGPCPVHVRIPICRESGQRATDACPTNLVDIIQFTAFPAAYRQWAEANGYPQPPAETCGIHNAGTRVAITSPYEGQTVSGIVEIQGSAIITGYSHYILEYGISHDPGGWGLVRDKTTVRVDNGTLGFWDTRDLGNGPHTLRILAFNGQGQSVESRVHVYVQNGTGAGTPALLLTSTPTAWHDMTSTPTSTFFALPTFTATATPTPSPAMTSSVTPTPSSTPTPWPTRTATALESPTAPVSPSPSATIVSTVSPTWTPSLTPRPTFTPSPSATSTPNVGPTLIVLPTLSPTPTPGVGPTLIVLPTMSPTSEGGGAPAPTRVP